MLHVIDNLLPASALQDLRDLCDVHGWLKQQHDGDAQFSWRPETGSPRSIHAAAQQAVVDRYLDEALLPSGNTVRISACRSRVVMQHQQRSRLAHRQGRAGRSTQRPFLFVVVHSVYPT